LWNKYGNEWSLLKTRINDYIQYFVEEKKLNKKWAKDVIEDIEKDNKSNILKNIYRFLKDYITEEDKQLGIKELLKKYSEEIAMLSKYEKETDVFGFYNAWWVFGEVAKELDYDIFMAEAENVGYKRTKRGENKMPNDLYDIEYAPQTLETDKIIDDYQIEISTKTATKAELESEKERLEKKIAKKEYITDKKKLDKIITEIEKIETEIEQLESDLEQIKKFFEKYYENNELKEEYYDRTDKELINYFENGLLKAYKSDDILLRKNEVIKILDAIRKEVVWE
jgi:type I restriction enzyme M protein